MFQDVMEKFSAAPNPEYPANPCEARVGTNKDKQDSGRMQARGYPEYPAYPC